MTLSSSEVRRVPRKPKPAPGSRRFSPLRLLGSVFVWAFTAGNVLVLYWLLTAAFKTPVEIFTKPFALPYQWFRPARRLPAAAARLPRRAHRWARG